MTALFFLVQLVLKIAVAPIVAALTLFVWFFTWLVCMSSVVLGLVSAVLFLLTASVEGFIIYMALAFLVSPFGLPMAALWLLGKVQGARYFIQERVYG